MEQIIETNTNQMVSPTQTTSSPPTNMTPATPILVKILAVLYYLAAIFLIFGGIMLAFVSSLSFSAFGSFGLGVGLLAGILTTGWGILCFATGSGLWKGREWGRILAITFAGLSIASGAINLIIFRDASYITYIGFAIQLAIILYLLLNKNVLAAFQPSGPKYLDIILAIAAIVIYAAIQYPSIKLKMAVLNSLQNVQQNSIPNNYSQVTNQNSTAGSVTNGNQNTIPQSTTSTGVSNTALAGTKIYTNSQYNFQMNVPQNDNPTESATPGLFNFYKDSNTLDLSISAEATTKSLKDKVDEFNVYVNIDRSPGDPKIQETDTTIAGVPAVRAIENLSKGGSNIWYLFVGNGKFYWLTKGPGVTNEQFDAMANSFKFTK